MESLKPLHSEFHVFTEYFGTLATDGEGTLIHGYETLSSKNKPFVGTPIVVNPDHGGCYGIVQSGDILTSFNGRMIRLYAGTWFSTKAGMAFTIGAGTRVCVFQRDGYEGSDDIGVMRDKGDLKYIDGCTDSILCFPKVIGMPCFNALYAPTGVHQTTHTHPSTRAGMIIKGDGAFCETPDARYPLEDGAIFFLPANGLHKFRTDLSEGAHIALVAYHPDSDFGPAHENHPMLNRTMVDGVSAANIEEIRTREL